MSPQYVKELKRKFWVVIKAATFVFCLAGFFGNTFMIFIQFIGKQTITSQDTQKNEELALPSFTICAMSGFKEKMHKYSDIELEGFHNKTLDFDEYLLYVEGMTIEELRENVTDWELTTTYSPYKGRCHTVRYIPKVKKSGSHNENDFLSHNLKSFISNNSMLFSLNLSRFRSRNDT